MALTEQTMVKLNKLVRTIYTDLSEQMDRLNAMRPTAKEQKIEVKEAKKELNKIIKKLFKIMKAIEEFEEMISE